MDCNLYSLWALVLSWLSSEVSTPSVPWVIWLCSIHHRYFPLGPCKVEKAADMVSWVLVMVHFHDFILHFKSIPCTTPISSQLIENLWSFGHQINHRRLCHSANTTALSPEFSCDETFSVSSHSSTLNTPALQPTCTSIQLHVLKRHTESLCEMR